jgi:hypothetical protein
LKLFREQIRIIALLIVAVVFIGGWFWWSHIFESPKAVFWGMFNNSMATSAVTRLVTENAGGQDLKETITLELGQHNIARANALLSENNSVVSTETIGTPSVDYTRYTAVKTATKSSTGEPFNFSGIVGVWSKSPTGGLSADPLDHLFGQSLLGIVPMGDLPPSERAGLLNQIKADKVFTTDFSRLQHGQVGGRAVDVFQVTVAPVAYAKLLKQFAFDEGYKNVPELSAGNYRGDAPLKVQFSINPVSRQLVEISYPGSNHTELYADYGVQPAITIPAHTISTAALEKRLLTTEQ